MGRRKDKETDTIKITNQEGIALATDPQPFDDGLAQLQPPKGHAIDHVEPMLKSRNELLSNYLQFRYRKLGDHFLNI